MITTDIAGFIAAFLQLRDETSDRDLKNYRFITKPKLFPPGFTVEMQHLPTGKKRSYSVSIK